MELAPACNQERRLATIALQVARAAPHLALDQGSFEPIGSGLEFDVYSMESTRFGQLAVKVARSRFINNDNDHDMDVRDILRQEAILLSAAGGAGIPSPIVHGCYFEDCGLDLIVLSRILTDGSCCDGRTKGMWLRRVHSVPCPPGFRPIAQRLSSLEQTLAMLICRRLEVACRIANISLSVPCEGKLADLLGGIQQGPVLLHMDFRDENLLCWNGDLRGLVDWSNALIANPVLELARVFEFGDLDSAFLTAYGACSFQARDPFVLACRLYTATMLAVVFLSECPDPEQAERRVAALRLVLSELEVAANWVFA